MTATKREKIYLEAPLHRALRLTYAETDVSISELVNDAIRHSLAEDVNELAAVRAAERSQACCHKQASAGG